MFSLLPSVPFPISHSTGFIKDDHTHLITWSDRYFYCIYVYIHVHCFQMPPMVKKKKKDWACYNPSCSILFSPQYMTSGERQVVPIHIKPFSDPDKNDRLGWVIFNMYGHLKCLIYNSLAVKKSPLVFLYSMIRKIISWHFIEIDEDRLEAEIFTELNNCNNGNVFICGHQLFSSLQHSLFFLPFSATMFRLK